MWERRQSWRFGYPAEFMGAVPQRITDIYPFPCSPRTTTIQPFPPYHSAVRFHTDSFALHGRRHHLPPAARTSRGYPGAKPRGHRVQGASVCLWVLVASLHLLRHHTVDSSVLASWRGAERMRYAGNNKCGRVHVNRWVGIRSNRHTLENEKGRRTVRGQTTGRPFFSFPDDRDPWGFYYHRPAPDTPPTKGRFDVCMYTFFLFWAGWLAGWRARKPARCGCVVWSEPRQHILTGCLQRARTVKNCTEYFSVPHRRVACMPGRQTSTLPSLSLLLSCTLGG